MTARAGPDILDLGMETTLENDRTKGEKEKVLSSLDPLS